MDKYEIYLKNGRKVKVKADEFDVDYHAKDIVFSVEDENIAIFNLNDIYGFKKLR